MSTRGGCAMLLRSATAAALWAAVASAEYVLDPGWPRDAAALNVSLVTAVAVVADGLNGTEVCAAVAAGGRPGVGLVHLIFDI